MNIFSNNDMITNFISKSLKLIKLLIFEKFEGVFFKWTLNKLISKFTANRKANSIKFQILFKSKILSLILGYM